MPIDLKRVQDVFQAVAGLPPAVRAAVLERECAGDAELRRRALALLKAHDDSAELPAPEQTGAYVHAPPLEPGQVFADRYKLREKLGEGGMGAVFVADQIEPVQRRVAIKVTRSGLDTHRLMARFEQERQALALMDDPNIAKVLDAGISPPSPPFARAQKEGFSSPLAPSPREEGWGEGSIAATPPLESNDSPRETMASVSAVAPPTTGSLSLGRGSQ